MSNSKSIVIDFIQAVNNEGIGALLRFSSTDMRWWAAGLGDLAAEQMIAMLEGVGEILEAPMALTIHDLIYEGDRVAVELESYAKLKNGKIYNNRYHLKFVLRDDKIAQIREYHDTRHAHEVLAMSMAEIFPPSEGLA